jgi:hypothetical protein
MGSRARMPAARRGTALSRGDRRRLDRRRFATPSHYGRSVTKPEGGRWSRLRSHSPGDGRGVTGLARVHPASDVTRGWMRGIWDGGWKRAVWAPQVLGQQRQLHQALGLSTGWSLAPSRAPTSPRGWVRRIRRWRSIHGRGRSALRTDPSSSSGRRRREENESACRGEQPLSVMAGGSCASGGWRLPCFSNGFLTSAAGESVRAVGTAFANRVALSATEPSRRRGKGRSYPDFNHPARYSKLRDRAV